MPLWVGVTWSTGSREKIVWAWRGHQLCWQGKWDDLNHRHISTLNIMTRLSSVYAEASKYADKWNIWWRFIHAGLQLHLWRIHWLVVCLLTLTSHLNSRLCLFTQIVAQIICVKWGYMYHCSRITFENNDSLELICCTKHNDDFSFNIYDEENITYCSLHIYLAVDSLYLSPTLLLQCPSHIPSIHIWRYSPFRALASLIRRLHLSLFSALPARSSSNC